jgi:hypothetical protein
MPAKLFQSGALELSRAWKLSASRTHMSLPVAVRRLRKHNPQVKLFPADRICN